MEFIHLLLSNLIGQNVQAMVQGKIFSSMVAVLARPKGGTIQNQRAEYFPILPDPRKCNNRFIV